jgi:hypothetical protein
MAVCRVGGSVLEKSMKYVLLWITIDPCNFTPKISTEKMCRHCFISLPVAYWEERIKRTGAHQKLGKNENFVVNENGKDEPCDSH